jgi:hypothetical protein
MKKVGPDDLKMLETIAPDIAFNYVYFLYKKFYDAYPTGEVYEILNHIFLKRQQVA